MKCTKNFVRVTALGLLAAQVHAGCLQPAGPLACSSRATVLPDCFGATDTAWNQTYSALVQAFANCPTVASTAASFFCTLGTTCPTVPGTAPLCQAAATTNPPPAAGACCNLFDQCKITQVQLPNIVKTKNEFCASYGDMCPSVAPSPSGGNGGTAPICSMGSVLCPSTNTCVDSIRGTCTDGPVLLRPIAAQPVIEDLRKTVISACALDDSSLFDPVTGAALTGTMTTLSNKIRPTDFPCLCAVQKALGATERLAPVATTGTAATANPFVTVLRSIATIGGCVATPTQVTQQLAAVTATCVAPFFWSQRDNACMPPQPVNSACPAPLVMTGTNCTLPMPTANQCPPPTKLVGTTCKTPAAFDPNSRPGRCPASTAGSTACTKESDCQSSMKCCGGNCVQPAADVFPQPAPGVQLPPISPKAAQCQLLKNSGEIISDQTTLPVSAFQSTCTEPLPTPPAPETPSHPCKEFLGNCANSNSVKSCLKALYDAGRIATATYCGRWVRDVAAQSTEPCAAFLDDATKCKKSEPNAALDCLFANWNSLPAACQTKLQNMQSDMPCDSSFRAYCGSYTDLYDKVDCLRAVVNSTDAAPVPQSCITLLGFSTACAWERVNLCRLATPDQHGIRACLIANAAKASSTCAARIQTWVASERQNAAGGKLRMQQTDAGCGAQSGMVQNSCTSLSPSNAGTSGTIATPPPTTAPPTTPPKVSFAASASPVWGLLLLAVLCVML